MVRIWIRKIRQFLFLLLLPLLIFGSFVALHREGFFSIREIHLGIADEQAMPLWLNSKWSEFSKDMEIFRDRDMWNLQLGEVTQKLSSYPWIQASEVSKSWPNSLQIKVRYKNLVAFAKTPKGRLVPLLSDGSRLNFDSLPVSVSLPVLSGNISIDDKDQILEALQFISLAPRPLADRISEIGFDPKEGYWTLILPFAVKIKWGFQATENRVLRVQKVLEYLDSRQLRARVIDANLSKKVVVRLRKDP